MAWNVRRKVAHVEGTAPGAQANTGFVYTKDDSGDTELYYIDDSGNEVQLTQDGAVSGLAASILTNNTIATIEALSPAAGDQAVATDGPFSYVAYAASWTVFHRGLRVVRPFAVSGWTQRQVDGSSTVLDANGMVEIIAADSGATADAQSIFRTMTEGNAYVAGFCLDNMFGHDSDTSFGGIIAYETATTKWQRFQLAGEMDAGFRVQEGTGLSGGAATMEEWTSATSNNEEGMQIDAVFLKIDWGLTTANTIEFSVAPSPEGPWRLFTSDADTGFFTTAPDEIGVFLSSRKADKPRLMLFHWEVLS